ncbi:MAG: diguanylate cyclase [Xanthobacteraceae bacterium]|nr:MAG: diguanylate cyclase [Xanthobacteraceae bacterium]
MTSGATFGFPLLLGASASDARQQRELLDELFDYRPYLMASAAMGLVILQVFLSGARGDAVASAVLVVVGAILRIMVARRYRAKGLNGDVARCAVHFAIMCICVAILWGLTGALLYRAADDNMRLVVLAFGCVLVQAVTFRTYMAPGPTMAQVVILIAFHAAAIVLDGLYVLIPICILYAGFQAMCIVSLGRVRVRQMNAEREMHRLLGELQRTNAELTRANLRLADSAMSDALTGIGNRRRFEEALALMSAAASWNGHSLSLLLIDVDHFKRFNDEHGHLAGDEALRLVADQLRKVASTPERVVARFGGEEFAVLMPNTDEDGARDTAERIRGLVGGPSVPFALTVSIGIATARGDAEIAQIVAAADRALYAAKRAGRNRVISSQDVDQQEAGRVGA